jgi:hypothetical protein
MLTFREKQMISLNCSNESLFMFESIYIYSVTAMDNYVGYLK